MMTAPLCSHVHTTSMIAMSNKNKTIHEFDFDLICHYFSHLERQGPGSPEATLKALGFLAPLNGSSRIADLGCGTGGQTMTLAGHVQGSITGIDLCPDFINIFNRQARQSGLQDRVKGVVGSMDSLPFEREELDLIWSEGAIYNIGFERGLDEWRQFLKPGGFIAVSESSWFTAERPEEIQRFWMDIYPEIDTIPNKVAQIQKAGYVPAAVFILPESCWTEHYHVPQTAVQEMFLHQYPGNETVEEFIAFQRHEAELYRKYKEFYGYVFYIAKKIEQ